MRKAAEINRAFQEDLLKACHLFRLGNNSHSKMLFMKVFLLIAAIIIIFGSCTQLYYAPNTPNSPLLSQKGEVRLNGNYAAGLSPVNQYSGAEFQGATAVSKHAGIMMNTMFIGGTDYWGKCNLS